MQPCLGYCGFVCLCAISWLQTTSSTLFLPPCLKGTVLMQMHIVPLTNTTVFDGNRCGFAHSKLGIGHNNSYFEAHLLSGMSFLLLHPVSRVWWSFSSEYFSLSLRICLLQSFLKELIQLTDTPPQWEQAALIPGTRPCCGSPDLVFIPFKHFPYFPFPALLISAAPGKDCLTVRHWICENKCSLTSF